MSVEVQFDEAELDHNTQVVLYASTHAQAEALKRGYQAFNNSVDLFIQQYEIAYQKINFFQNELKKIIKKWHDAKKSITGKGEDYKQSSRYIEYLNERKTFMQDNFLDDLKETTLNIYLLSLKIQQLLNAALGQQVVTAYVFQEGGSIAPSVILSHDMKDFLSVEVSSSGNLILRYRQNRENLNNHIEKLQEMVQVEKEDKNYSKLVTAYNKAHKRYSNFPLKRKSGSYVLWLYPYGGQRWNGAYVSSFGSINEVYTYFLFHLDEFNPSDAQEDDMEVLMNYLLTEVTNESGLLSGDFQNGQMEIAVKSADASVLGIKQIYNLVKKIKKQKTNNFQSIVQFLMKEKKKNASKARPINKSLKQSLQNIADKHIPPAIGALTS